MSKALLLLGLAAALSGGTLPPVREQKKNNKMPLNEEELAKLATLSGKEKKMYVKELRRKYVKSGR